MTFFSPPLPLREEGFGGRDEEVGLGLGQQRGVDGCRGLEAQSQL